MVGSFLHDEPTDVEVVAKAICKTVAREEPGLVEWYAWRDEARAAIAAYEAWLESNREPAP